MGISTATIITGILNSNLACSIQIRARTVNIQFDGLAPITDVVVDKVGRYSYSVSNANAGQLTVIMDVSLNVRTKVMMAGHNGFHRRAYQSFVITCRFT